jgi:hypothetical protein
MNVMHPELRQAVRQAGNGLVRLTDPDTKTEYVLVPAEVFQRVRQLLDDPEDTYVAIDEAWKEGWDEPQMADYDDYERHKS